MRILAAVCFFSLFFWLVGDDATHYQALIYGSYTLHPLPVIMGDILYLGGQLWMHLKVASSKQWLGKSLPIDSLDHFLASDYILEIGF